MHVTELVFLILCFPPHAKFKNSSTCIVTKTLDEYYNQQWF